MWQQVGLVQICHVIRIIQGSMIEGGSVGLNMTAYSHGDVHECLYADVGNDLLI